MDQTQINLFAKNMKQLRIGLGLSQEELANKIGTSKQVISRYESALRSPKIAMADKIAKALGADIASMLGQHGTHLISGVEENDDKFILHNDNEIKLIIYYRKLVASQKEELLRYARFLYQENFDKSQEEYYYTSAAAFGGDTLPVKLSKEDQEEIDKLLKLNDMKHDNP